jgi:hypothetical protein
MANSSSKLISVRKPTMTVDSFIVLGTPVFRAQLATPARIKGRCRPNGPRAFASSSGEQKTRQHGRVESVSGGKKPTGSPTFDAKVAFEHRLRRVIGLQGTARSLLPLRDSAGLTPVFPHCALCLRAAAHLSL